MLSNLTLKTISSYFECLSLDSLTVRLLIQCLHFWWDEFLLQAAALTVNGNGFRQRATLFQNSSFASGTLVKMDSLVCREKYYREIISEVSFDEQSLDRRI